MMQAIEAGNRDARGSCRSQPGARAGRGHLRGGKGIAISGDTGTLEPGRCADMIVLNEDPLTDIRALRSIRAVYRNGQEVKKGMGRD
jgi:cytosine/adenosine deaminase-related metal-dependent hydrolase